MPSVDRQFAEVPSPLGDPYKTVLCATFVRLSPYMQEARSVSKEEICWMQSSIVPIPTK